MEKASYYYFIKFIFYLLLFLPFVSAAQHENDNWYMGNILGLQFNGNQQPTVLNNSKMYAPYASAVMSNKITGKLLFYTDGIKVWNADHTIMQNGTGLLASGQFYCMEVIIVPVPESNSKYYIFSIGLDYRVFFAEIDMTLNNGLGDVVYKRKLLANDLESYFTVVKHEYGDGFWLIAHKTVSDAFYAYRINKNGVETTPVISSAGSSTFAVANLWKTGQLVSSNNGRKLVRSNYYNNNVELFEFDKVCGKVVLNQLIQLPWPGNNCGNSLGLAFAPNDTLLYITYYCSNSSVNIYLTQFNIYSPSPMHTAINIANSNDALREMRLGPDGRIYIVTSENGAVTSKLDVILYPDKFSTNCGYKKYYLRLNPGDISYFTEHFPNFINDKTSPGNSPSKPEIIASNSCLGETTNFILQNFPTNLDSFIWEFGDGTFFTNYKPANSVSKTYSKAGKYLVKYKWYQCGYEYSVEKEIEIGEKPVVNLGYDTTLCAGTTFTLGSNVQAQKYLWNTGATDSAITVNAEGKYSVIASNGNCTATDTIEIKYYPEIWTALGKEYFICEEENELVKLDAGKEFEKYLWHPTADTTQWIIVSKTGDYYVIVKDFRGCNGQDGTIVQRKCPVYLQFPNAFSPNHDGLNDEFKPVAEDIVKFNIRIYNRWGEKVFESDDIDNGWDGKYKGIKAQDGVYFYMSSYSGYGKNQAFQNYHKSGYFTLFR